MEEKSTTDQVVPSPEEPVIQMPADASKLAQAVKDQFQQVIDAMPIEMLLATREHMKKAHAEQIQLITNKLKEKGYVEPHLEGALKFRQE